MSWNIRRVRGFTADYHILLPAAVTAGLQHFILVILSSLLVYPHQFLPTDLTVENPLEVLRLPGQVSSLSAGQFLLLSLPFLLTLGDVDPNTPGTEVPATDVARDECWWHLDCVGSLGSGAVLSPLTSFFLSSLVAGMK